MINTDEILLDRVKELDAHEAWKEFYDNYWAAIIRYGRKIGLSETQAKDVLQETMVDLMRILPRFDYNQDKGRFRNFLLTIVHRKSISTAKRDVRNSGEPWDDSVHSHDKNQSRTRDVQVDEEAVQRWKESIMEEEFNSLRNSPEIEPQTWKIFEAYVVQNNPAKQVAGQFEVAINAVYQIKNRLLKRVQKNVERRLRDSGSIDEPPPRFSQ